MISLNRPTNTWLNKRLQSRNTQQTADQGFTIVELLVVIVVIAILALLVITTYSGIQAKARNAQRQSDIGAIQTQLEAYFTTAGHYPNLADMNDGTWLTANMANLDLVALADPSNATLTASLGAHPTSGTLGAVIGSAPTSGATAQYEYLPAVVGASTPCAAAGAVGADGGCLQYTLAASLESPASVYKKTNLD